MENCKQINLFIIYLIPLFLIFSHSLADLVIIFTGLNFLVFLILKKLNITIKVILNDKIVISFFLFYIFLVLSSLLSEFHFLSLKRSIPYIRFLIFIVALKYWLLKDYKNFKILYLSTTVCLVFVCTDVLFQFYNYEEIISDNGKIVRQGIDIFGYASNPVIERFQGPFKDEYIAGGYILKLSPFLFLTVLANTKTKEKNFLIFFSLILVVYSIYITGDRAPFFILILISLIIPFFFSKKIIFIYLSSLILLIYLAGTNLDKKQRYFYDALGALGFKNNEFTLDTGYGYLFYSAIKIWVDKPLLGAGTKNYRKICGRDEYNFETENNIQLCSTHPHNYVLELLSETGLVGLILFYYIFFRLFIYASTLQKIFTKDLNNIDIKFLTMSLILILWPISTTGSILTNKNSIMLWFVFGMLYSFQSLKENKTL